MLKEQDESAAGMVRETEAIEPVFQDWARFVSFKPQLYFRPQDLDELKGFLKSILQGTFKHRSLRVMGSLHSCSDICVSDIIIDVNDMPRTLEFNDDHSLVTASVNWHLHEFLQELSKYGKSISATGGTDEQTLAGVISTNTAPATPQHTIYELVEWIEMITVDEGTQSIVERRVAKTDPDFPAMIGALGATGILTRVQFRLIDEPFYETVQKIIKIKDVLADIVQTSKKYDFWRIDWLPDTDEGLLWAATRIKDSRPGGDYPSDQAQNILEFIFNALDKVESAGPLLDSALRVVYAGLAFSYGVVNASGPLRNMLPVDRYSPLHVAMAEWSFNPADLNRLLESCKAYYQQHGWPNLPIEIELTKTDNYFMSAWNWPGLDYIIKFNFMYATETSGTQVEKEAIFTHLRGLWEHLTRAGIPFKAHWGKINFMDYDFVCEHYEFERFKPFIREAFLNKYLSVRFNPPA